MLICIARHYFFIKHIRSFNNCSTSLKYAYMLFSAISPRAVAGLTILTGLFQCTRADVFEKLCYDLKRSLESKNITINLVKYIPSASNIRFPDNIIIPIASNINFLLLK